jgi:hypothetical protein
MINLVFNPVTRTAEIAASTTIRSGCDVAVRLTCLTDPGDFTGLELGLGVGDPTPSLLAFTDVFTAENETTFLATLNTNDTRLLAYLVEHGASALSLELGFTLNGDQDSCPNIPINVQPRMITAGAGSLGGPVWIDSTALAAAIAAAQLPAATLLEAQAGTETALRSWSPARIKALAQAMIDALVGGAPGALDTLVEIATALNNDADLAATLTAAIAAKLSPDGDGSALQALNASALTSGTIPDARFPAMLPEVNGSLLQHLNAASLEGALPPLDGSALTGVTKPADITDLAALRSEFDAYVAAHP